MWYLKLDRIPINSCSVMQAVGYCTGTSVDKKLEGMTQ